MPTTPSRRRQRASVSTTCARTRARADNAHPRPGEHPRKGRARCGHGRPRPLPGETPALRPGALRTRSTWTRSTTPAARGNTRARARPQEDCSGSRAAPSEYAHKDPDLRNTNRTQGLDPALACDPVFLNSRPCVRHQRRRTPKRDEAKEQTHQRTAHCPHPIAPSGDQAKEAPPN